MHPHPTASPLRLSLVVFALGATLSKGPGGGGELPLRVTVGAVAAKLLITPACNTGLVLLMNRVLPGTDPLALLIMTVLGASPAAMNMCAVAPSPQSPRWPDPTG